MPIILSTLHTQTPVVSTSFSSIFPPTSMNDIQSFSPVVQPICTTAAVQPFSNINVQVCHASTFTQTTPISHLPFTNDSEVNIPISLWQSNANNLQSIKIHVNALLQLNLLLAQLLLTRIEVDRFLTAYEQFVVQTSVSQLLWPNTFLYCSRVSELLNAILVWLYEQL